MIEWLALTPLLFVSVLVVCHVVRCRIARLCGRRRQ